MCVGVGVRGAGCAGLARCGDRYARAMVTL